MDPQGKAPSARRGRGRRARAPPAPPRRDPGLEAPKEARQSYIGVPKDQGPHNTRYIIHDIECISGIWYVARGIWKFPKIRSPNTDPK